MLFFLESGADTRSTYPQYGGRRQAKEPRKIVSYKGITKYCQTNSVNFSSSVRTLTLWTVDMRDVEERKPDESELSPRSPRPKGDIWIITIHHGGAANFAQSISLSPLRSSVLHKRGERNTMMHGTLPYARNLENRALLMPSAANDDKRISVCQPPFFFGSGCGPHYSFFCLFS